jgi:hypothetical protein
MSKVETGLVGLSSGIISFFSALFNYTGLENFSGIIRLIAIVLSALTIGMGQGFRPTLSA